MSFQKSKVLLIVNPAAQNGRGADASKYAAEILENSFELEKIEVLYTNASKHGQQLAGNACGFDAVIALGGDGLVHEVINGLMTIDPAMRPCFALLPMGTGNDYARTLNMSFKIDESIKELAQAKEQLIDLGICNGEYFAETLSFGLDADIAIDTMERRLRTGRTGTALFIESGINVLFNRLIKHNYQVSFDDQEFKEGQMYQFAIQIGKTYGGGFAVCPDARTDDGLFDICIAHPPLNIPKATMIFLLAKNGHHKKFKQIEFMQAKKVKLKFSEQEQVPAQMDGECFLGHEFEIACVPAALKVLVANKK